MKKLLSFCLALIMIFSLSSVSFAVDEVKQTCPMIFIPGFSSSDIYSDITDSDTLITFPDVDTILTAVGDTLVPYLALYLADRNADRLTAKVTERINEMFAPWFNELTGEAPEGSGIIPKKLTYSSPSSEHTFSYDWRGDPVKIADELSEYIEDVCELSGCEKVTLAGHSLGSAIALSYLAKYGNDRVSAMVFDSPACNGVELIGNVFTGRVNLDADGLAYFIKTYLGESEYERLVKGFVDILKKAGLFDAFNLLADEVIKELAPGIYKGTIAPLLGCWPTMWSMLPDDTVDEAKAYIIDELLKDKDTTLLEKKIDDYNKNVRAKRTETLQNFNDVSNFAILSRYSNQTIPLRASASHIGDLIIETSSTSFGATTAPMGDYFSDSYLKDKNADFISPDKTVDASTCLFPENTWFIKNSGHFETDGLTSRYYGMFLYAEKELTTESGELSRFLYKDEITYTLVEDTTTPQKREEPDIIEVVYNFAKALVESLVALVRSIG